MKRKITKATTLDDIRAMRRDGRKTKVPKDAEALYQSALEYLNGDSNDVLRNKAVSCLRKASLLDHTAAQLLLFRTLLKENRMTSFEEGLRWLMRGAKLGDPNCMIDLGFMYQTNKKFAQARYWYQKAIANGNVEAKWYLEQLPR